MVRMHALELVPDERGGAAVLDDWQALRDAGLPSQLDHRGATNAPHLTVVSAPLLPPEAVDVARARLVGLLPVPARISGLLVLGGQRVTLAWALDVGDLVLRRVLAVRAQVPDRHPEAWLPHITLARRMPRDRVAEAVGVLGERAAVGRELGLAGLRRWDPACEKVEQVLV